MAKHVWVDREWHLGGLPDTLDEAMQADGADRPTAFGNEHVIPSPIDQNSCAHWRNPRDMMRQGWSTSLFQGSQQWSTRSSYDLKIRFESQLSRMNCHTFSTGLSSGHLGGSVMMVTLAGTTRRVDMCQPAWSTRRIAWAAGSTVAAISARCRFIASVLQAGRIRAAPLPCFGQTAPKM